MPKAVWMLLLVLIINITFLLLYFKEMKLTTFDPVYAASIGIPVVFLYYGFVAMISFTTIAAFDSVGTILVGPAATSYLISKRLNKCLFIACYLVLVRR